MRIPAANFKPILEHTETTWRARLDEMFAKGQFILGEQGAAFEREFAEAMGARAAVNAGNGTAAIELCLRDAGIVWPHMEAITSALTAPFTGVGIAAAGCGVRFADVDPETLLLDPDDAGNRATKRTKAVVPVHLYGQPCDLGRFRALARRLSVTLIQDACQAHGAQWAGKPLTAYGRYVAYSFYPTKNLGALGDGGAITVSQGLAAKRLQSLRDGGRRGGQVSHSKGINSRLDEMQACYLRAFLPNLAAWNAHRAKIAAAYDRMLADVPHIRRVKTSAGSVNHLYVIRIKQRDELRRYLGALGIGAGVHYPVPLRLIQAFREAGLRKGDLPHAEKACGEVLSLPLWPYMPESAAEEVADRVRAWARG